MRVEVEELPPLLDPLASQKVFKKYQLDFGPGASAAEKKAAREAAFASAARVVEGEYRVSHQEQMYIEPNAICALPREDGGVTIHGSMQCPFYIHRAMQRLLALPEEKIAVIQAVTGGGFGGKEDFPSVIASHAALLARKSGRPVKIIYKRDEDVACTTKRHPAIMKLKTAVAADGTFLACEIDVVMDGGAYVTLSPVVASRAVLHAAGAYRWPHALIDCRVVQTHTIPNGAFRGFGVPQTIFAIESHVEKIAHEMGLDPLAVRRKNCFVLGDVTPTGQVLRWSVSARESLDAVAELSRFDEKRAAFAQARIDHPHARKVRGIGMSLAHHGAGFTGSGEDKLKARAGVELTATGARVLAISTDIGQGTNTIFAQMAAEPLGLPMSAVEVAQPDTSKVPDSGPTVASRTLMVVGGTVAKAARAMASQLASFVAERHGVPADEVVCTGGVFTHAAPGQAPRELAAFAEIAAARLSQGPLVCIEQYKHPAGIHFDDETYAGDAYPCFGWAATAVEVTVDLDTCEITLDRVTTANDIGAAVNPVLAAGQIEGGTVQALGYALLEEHHWKNGHILNTRMQNYLIPTSLDAPHIDTIIIENPYPHGPWGAKGLGELPMDGPAPAVLAAVLHATGQLVPVLPITPERLMNAIEGQP